MSTSFIIAPPTFSLKARNFDNLRTMTKAFLPSWVLFSIYLTIFRRKKMIETMEGAKKYRASAIKYGASPRILTEDGWLVDFVRYPTTPFEDLKATLG